MSGVRIPRRRFVAAMVRSGAAVALAAASLGIATSPADAVATTTQYRLVDLGAIGTFTYGEAYSVSERGVAVGTFSDSVGSHAFAYSGGSLVSLPAPDEFAFTRAGAVNAHNVIAGAACAAEDQCHAVRWSGFGSVTDLGTLAGGTEAYPTGMNEIGTIVGHATVAGPLQHAFVAYATSSNLVDLNYYTGGSTWTLTNALDINGDGDIVGRAVAPGDQWHGFMLKSGYTAANLVDLGNTVPMRINDARHIVTRDMTDRVFLYDGASSRAISGLPGYDSMIVGDLNNQDEVVGYVYNPSASCPFLYRNGVTYDLRTLIGPSSWTLDAAFSINEKGEIAGYAQKNGVTHPVLLVPTWPVASTYMPVEPTRVLDTRIGLGLSGSFVAGVARKLAIPRAVIPPEATAVTGNLTITGATAGGYVAAGPTVSAGATSVLNAGSKEARANGITVQLAPDGTLTLLYGPPSTARAHLVLDITGYFVPDDGGYQYTTITPKRMYDSRTPTHNPVKVGTPRLIPLSVPSNAVAVTGNLTITQPSAGGWVAVGPTPSPTTSTINFAAGQTIANNVTVTMTPGGALYAVFGGPATGSRVDVVFDLTGYFTSGVDLRFTPVAPTRIVDTRTPLGISSKLSCSAVRTVTVPTATVPATAKAIVGNATIVRPSSKGYLVLGPAITLPPMTSTLNYVAGDIRANGATFRLATGGTSTTFQAAIGGCPAGATTDFVFDAMGYYR